MDSAKHKTDREMKKLNYQEWIEAVTKGYNYDLHCINHKLTNKIQKKSLNQLCHEPTTV